MKFRFPLARENAYMLRYVQIFMKQDIDNLVYVRFRMLPIAIDDLKNFTYVNIR